MKKLFLTLIAVLGLSLILNSKAFADTDWKYFDGMGLVSKAHKTKAWTKADSEQKKHKGYKYNGYQREVLRNIDIVIPENPDLNNVLKVVTDKEHAPLTKVKEVKPGLTKDGEPIFIVKVEQTILCRESRAGGFHSIDGYYCDLDVRKNVPVTIPVEHENLFYLELEKDSRGEKSGIFWIDDTSSELIAMVITEKTEARFSRRGGLYIPSKIYTNIVDYNNSEPSMLGDLAVSISPRDAENQIDKTTTKDGWEMNELDHVCKITWDKAFKEMEMDGSQYSSVVKLERVPLS